MKDTNDSLSTRLQRALYTQDAEEVAAVIDFLRFADGFTYDECYEMAAELTGISPALWDELLYEADSIGC